MQADDNTRRAPRWLKILAAVLSGLLLIAVMATAALWWWAGSDGSLATGLRWVAKYQPLLSEGASGSLRKGGEVKRLVWQQDGVTVEVTDVALSWQPWSLLHGTLQLNRLSAATVRVDDQRPPSTTPSLPPAALGLPLRIALDDFAVGRFQWQGSPAIEVQGIAGNYLYTGLRHELSLKNAQFANGHYQGKATLASAQPLELEATLTGTVEAPAPGRTTTLPLTFNAGVKGPLTELALKAVLQMQAGKATVAGLAPHATATARVTPWAAQPLPEADADFRALDVATLWPDAPQTRLTGHASVRAAQTGTTSAWSLQTQLVNELPGPWDKKRLPLERLQAQGEWRDGAVMVRSLRAGLGGGELTATGQWLGAPQTSKPHAPNAPNATDATGKAVRQDWSVQATFEHINPGALHTQFASLPIDGRAETKSQGSAIAFDASLSSANAPQATRSAPPQKGYQLRLRDATATGRWDAGQAGGTLALSAFRVRTDDAEAAGSLEAQPAAKAGKGRVTLTAPGLQAQAQGELRQASGAGTLDMQAKDASQALRWLQKLPGMPVEVQAASASGNAALTLAWQGGWQDPALQARLQVPSLDWRSGPLKTAATTATPSLPLSPAATQIMGTVTTAASVLKIRALEASLNGKLSQAQLALQGRVESGTRRYALQLAADGGRITAARQGALDGWATSAWQSVVKQLSLSLEDPALGDGAWRLSTRGNVALRWSPGAAGGTFESSAGEAVLIAPSRSNNTAAPAASSQALVQWQPIRRRGGELTTAGRITGLPLAWIELVAGEQMAGAGLTGNLVFDGTWDAQLGEALRVKASIARSSGDISVQGENTQGTTARVAAGVKDARLSLDSNGDALRLALRWDSERAGTADGQLTTRLAKDPAGGWTWPADAPLRGQLRAQLPRIGVWSVLAPPGWRLRGTLGANVAISGTRALPQLAGDLTANDLALRSVVDGIEFGNGRLRARLDGTRMRINEFTLQGAGTNNTGGTLTAQGEAAWLDGKPQVQLDARLDRLRASIRTDRQVTLSGELQAKLEGKLAQFTGKLKVDQARILLPDEGTPQLGDDVVVRSSSGTAAGRKAPAETSASRTPTKQDSGALKIAVDIDLGQDFRVQGKGMDTRVRGSLALTGDTITEPRLVGTVNTFGGQYRAYGQRLDVEQGVLRFTGPIDNPALDILAIRPNLTQRVGVQITGTALLPRVRLYAQPELPDAEKLSWLVVGRASASGGAEAALLQQAALALLGSKSGGMSGGLASSLGLDELSFRGAASNTDGTTTEGAVTLGKRFSRNFYAAYERSISGALGTLFVFYDLSQRFTVRAQAGQQSAVDLIFTFPYD
ncbi:MAG: translocation/assembly module TamB domain-containing protein [Pseudomonadota bacterium]